MTTTTLTDGRVLHIPGVPFILDSTSVIGAPADDDLAKLAPLVSREELAPFAKRLLSGVNKRRREPRYCDVDRARLRLARLCIDRMLSFEPGSVLMTDTEHGSAAEGIAVMATSPSVVMMATEAAPSHSLGGRS